MSSSQRSIAFVTMGCAKNEVDTLHMKRALSSAGYLIVEEPSEADAVVVNTCSFIQSATEESIDAIMEVAQLPNVVEGDARVVVAGCMPARYREGLSDELHEADILIPCDREGDIVALVNSLWGLDVQENSCEVSEERTVSAYVKISDGCDRFCSYCTIPFIRGRYHSFAYEEIHFEVERHVSNGVREVVLIAQDTGRWGQDFDDPKTLDWLLGRLASEYPDTWFRVMYIQPEGVTDDLLNTIASHGNICSYLDIPLQHVEESILRAMNRRGSKEEFLELIKRIRAVIPDVTLRTTLIAGFPGETDEQFDSLCDFVELGLFDYVGVFPYSREEGTASYSLPDQLEDDEKNDRAQRLRDIADAVCVSLISERVGRRMPVLIEGVEEDGQLFGRTQCQAPEVDGATYVNHGSIGDVVDVVISDTLFYEMEGE